MIGKKPEHHREILNHAKMVVPNLGESSKSAQSIRRVIGHSSGPTENALSARKHIQRLSKCTISWDKVFKNLYLSVIPARNCEIRLKLSHNALPTNANLAKWSKKEGGGCIKCNGTEDAIHVFMCESFSDLRLDILEILKPVIEPGITFLDLIFCKAEHPLVQALVAETMYNMWISRCRSQHEGKKPNCKSLFAKVVCKVKNGLKQLPNAAVYECQIFDAKLRNLKLPISTAQADSWVFDNG